jgi:hypothetical protein
MKIISGHGSKEEVENEPITTDTSQPKWCPPRFGRYKSNWDVALDPRNHYMGVGVVVRDYGGAITAALSRRMGGCLEPVHAESMGAVMAAEFCRDLGLQDIVLEGDSLLAAKALKCARPN